MILDIISYLKADSTLDSLLGADANNSKIYPNQVPQGTQVPFIRYALSGDGTLEENLSEIVVTFDCISDNYLQVRNIRDRLVTLLDKQDKIREVISSSGYYLYWCKNTNGADEKEPVQSYYHRTVIFNIKYAKK